MPTVVTSRRFLLCGHDAGGTVPPMLALAQEMVARGHAVTYLSQPSVRQRALAAGCRFESFDRVGDYRARTALEEQIELIMTVMTGAEIGEQLTATARDERSDAVVVDCNLAGAAAGAETLDVPTALLLHSMYKTYTDVWFAEYWSFMEAAINDTRRAYRREPAGSWADVFRDHDRLISVVPAAFDASVAAVPDTLHHFGFLVPTPQPTNSPAAFPDGDDPAVLVSLSTTYQHQEHLLEKILHAVAARPVRALVTTGGQVDPADLSVPPNATLVDYVDHGLVLNETDALITHGGLGTVAGGLSHGLPMVCIPLGRDQQLNAERVADLNAGIALATDASSDQIGESLDQLLSNPTFRDAAVAISSASLASGGAAAAVDDLESFVMSAG